MAGNEHRAAAVQLYKTLAKFAEGSFRTIYLDHCQSILGKHLLLKTGFRVIKLLINIFKIHKYFFLRSCSAVQYFLAQGDK